MIEDKLEITIPTYNRAKYLDRILSQLFKSPFVNCHITIFDNHSSDETPRICKKYKNLLPNLTVIKRPANIGGNANILRGFENKKKEYNWVLGDNDCIDSSDCDDVLNEIESGKFDVILTWSPEDTRPNVTSIQEILLQNKKSESESYLKTNGLELIKLLGIDYFVTFSFISSFIYKSELFDSKCLINGYDNIYYQYPHYPFIIKIFEENFSVYKSKKNLIVAQPNPKDSEKTDLYWTVSWLNSSLLIKDKELRKIGFNFPEGSMLPVILGHIIFAKALNEEGIDTNLISLKCVCRKIKGFFIGGIYSILISIINLMPKLLCKYIYNYYKANKEKIVK